MVNTTVPQIFNFNEAPLRVIIQASGDPLFCASDVAKALGYTNGSQAVTDHCRSKGIFKNTTFTAGGPQLLTFLDEPNLYRLVMRSNVEHSDAFQDWVTEQVLPTIRKTGSYSSQLASPPDQIQLMEMWLTQAKEKQQLHLALSSEREEKQRLAEQMQQAQPKLEKYALFMASESYIDFETLAKNLATPGFGRNRILSFLREERILMTDRSNKQNYPYAAYAQYFKVTPIVALDRNGVSRTRYEVLISPRGQKFIVARAKLRGVL